MAKRAATRSAKSGTTLRESLERLRQMFESVTDGISVIDLNGTIVEVNQRVVEMHGFNSKEELIGRSAFSLVAPEDHERIAANMRQAIKQGKVKGMEYTLLRADGSRFPGELSTSVLRDASGRWIGHITIARDISERKRMELELRSAQEQLVRAEKLAAIGQLASGVGHELRNPLGAIKNAALYLKRKIAKSELATSEPRIIEFIDLIDEEVDRANKVITDLLSFSRVGKPAVSLVNVGGILRSALARIAVPENVEVSLAIDPTLPMVMVDSGQIEQVFINIILNALEAMPEGGRLEIRTRAEADYVKVEFSDSGCGIPQSVIGKIFDPLFTTKAKGIGLGLALTKSIIERHGGDIGVTSQEGKGTTFILSLPTRAA